MARPTASKQGAQRPGWSNTAFVVEALVLLVVLIACMAVFTQLFARSASLAADTERMATATALAQSAAEEFSSDPESVAVGRQVGLGVSAGNVAAAGLDDSDDFTVSCTVDAAPTTAGVLYTAHITVSDSLGEAYALTTTRYVSEVS